MYLSYFTIVNVCTDFEIIYRNIIMYAVTLYVKVQLYIKFIELLFHGHNCPCLRGYISFPYLCQFTDNIPFTIMSRCKS